MWISKAEYLALHKEIVSAKAELGESWARMRDQLLTLERMNTRLQGDLDWAKLRLNSVEKERAQLIAAAIGVKVSIPEFVPQTQNLGDALNEMPDLSTIGNDAIDELGKEQGEPDYSMMPGYRGK
jgi:hypothetical protein